MATHKNIRSVAVALDSNDTLTVADLKALIAEVPDDVEVRGFCTRENSVNTLTLSVEEDL